MPIRIQNDLPAKEILENENIFIMDENRAMHQDIRPLQILVLNLMPLKEDTELQILRLLSNSPLQVDVTFLMVSTHNAKNTSKSHLNQFYLHFDQVRDRFFDGMIITGAPIEMMEFEEVDFWPEMEEILDWTETHVTSTMYQCWGAQAAMYHFYGVKKYILPEKITGVFMHSVVRRKIPLVRGFDDAFRAPHSRHTEVRLADVKACEDIEVLAESKEAGFLLGMADEGRKIFVQGHPEYDRFTLDKEYHRDLAKGGEVQKPAHYYDDLDDEGRPLLTWRAHSAHLYMNWLNYYVYQTTPYDMFGTPDFHV